MANTIKLKRGSGSDPSASDLAVGEVAVRTDEGKLFTKKDDGSVAEISGGGGIDDGDKGDITVSNSGATFTIDSGVITNAKISGSAAIAGTKISPDFGSQNIVTTGTLSCTDITSSDGTPSITLNDSANNQFAFIDGNSGNLVLHSDKGGTGSSSTMKFGIDNSIKMTLDASGNLNMDGTCTATTFSGSGASLTSIPAGQLTGTINDARIPDVITPATLVSTIELRSSNGQQLVLNAGESAGKISGQTGEYIYVNAESGLSVNTPDSANPNWVGGTASDQTLITGTAITIDGNTVFHQGNDGAGSGLDADTLDGIQGSAFLRSDTSDTMTGDLTIGDGSADTRLLIKKADNNEADHIQFFLGSTRMGEIGSLDTTWLRINQETAKNIYTPRIIRADGGFQVDGSTVINGTGSYVRNLSGASDYSSLLRSDTADTASGDITFSGGAGAATIAANSDISFTSGSTWSGNHTKITHHSNVLYIVGGTAGIIFREGGTNRWRITGDGHFDPQLDSTYDIGETSSRVRVGYFDEIDSAEVRVNNGILEVKSEIAASHTLTSGYNAMAVDPTVNSGVTVTVPSGAVWAIV